MQSTADSALADAPRTGDIYRAVWRWHFYAGLLVLPFLILLSVTGGLYLFQKEIDGYWYRDLKTVAVRDHAPLPASQLLAAALAAQPGEAGRYTPPSTPSSAAQVLIRAPDGERQIVHVDPYDARVLGTLPDKGTIMGVIRRLHSLDYVGPIANGAIEIAAGWTIMLVLTGLYLWWPRGRRAGVITVRGTPSKRVFWRDVHAVGGCVLAVFILFLATTGMPWSLVWGGKVNQWANGSNFGYPAGVRVAVPMSDEHLAHQGHTSWTMEQAKMPMSSAPAFGGEAFGLDRAVAAFKQLGLAPGYAIALPSGPHGVYTGSVYPNDLSQQRVVHLDRYTGRVLLDMGYADYGPLGKGLEWGINVHMGQEFGLANQIVLALACVGIVLFCVAAGTMWWMRRPAGRLGVPAPPADRRALRGVLTLLVVGGIIFPLMGASLVVIWVIDRVATRPARVVTTAR